MISNNIVIWTKAVILLAILWEPTLGWRWITNDAIIRNVWPDSNVRDSVKIKRASSANIGPSRGKQAPPKSSQSSDSSQDEDDGLIFEGHYFSPNEVPPPPPFMVVNNNWEGKSHSTVSPPISSPPPPAPLRPILKKQQRPRPSSYYTGSGKEPTPSQAPEKFTAEHAKTFKNNSIESRDSDSTSSSNSRNVVSSPIPLEDLQYHEDELIQFEATYKDAPKCFTPTDVPGRCIPFRNCFPVVFNVIDGDLRNPGLAKLLYQASGPCNASLELDFALSKDHKKYFNSKFYNQSICCPGFKHPPTLLKAWTSGDVRSVRVITSTPKSSNGEDASTTISASNLNTDHHSQVVENEPFITITKHDGKSTPPLKEDESSIEGVESDVTLEEPDGGSEITIEFEEANTDENNDFAEGEQLAFLEIEKENPKISSIINYTSLVDIAELRRGDRDEAKKGVENSHNSYRPSDTYLAVEPPSVSPTCQHQLHGMPRGHWPWMVALVISSRHICSGVLVDDRNIVTAAHCVYLLNQDEVKKLRVIVGDRVMYSSIDGPHFWRKISKITTHVNYNQQTFASDIAILRMSSAVPFSRNVQPVSLPDGSFDSINIRNAIVAGWSGADIGQPAFEPRTEVETVVDIMDKMECRDIYRGFALSGLATNTFCTKPANNTCVADSGAPLIARIQNCWRLVGIMSWGIGCSHFPEVYTDVSKYMSWIRKHLE